MGGLNETIMEAEPLLSLPMGVQTLGDNRVGWIPNCEDAAPPRCVPVCKATFCAFCAFRYFNSSRASGGVCSACYAFCACYLVCTCCTRCARSTRFQNLTCNTVGRKSAPPARNLQMVDKGIWIKKLPPYLIQSQPISLRRVVEFDCSPRAINTRDAICVVNEPPIGVPVTYVNADLKAQKRVLNTVSKSVYGRTSWNVKYMKDAPSPCTPLSSRCTPPFAIKKFSWSVFPIACINLLCRNTSALSTSFLGMLGNISTRSSSIQSSCSSRRTLFCRFTKPRTNSMRSLIFSISRGTRCCMTSFHNLVRQRPIILPTRGYGCPAYVMTSRNFVFRRA